MAALGFDADLMGKEVGPRRGPARRHAGDDRRHVAQAKKNPPPNPWCRGGAIWRRSSGWITAGTGGELPELDEPPSPTTPSKPDGPRSACLSGLLLIGLALARPWGVVFAHTRVVARKS